MLAFSICSNSNNSSSSFFADEKDGRNGLNVTHERQVCVARLIGPDRWEHAIPLDIRSVPSALMPPNWIYMPRVLDGGQIGCT